MSLIKQEARMQMRGKNHYLVNSVTICMHEPIHPVQLVPNGNQDQDQKFEVLHYQ